MFFWFSGDSISDKPMEVPDYICRGYTKIKTILETNPDAFTFWFNYILKKDTLGYK
jgi:hypothetical protein